MIMNKRKKHQKKSYQPFRRPSLLLSLSKHRLNYVRPKTDRTIRLRRLVRKINATYQTLCFTISLVVRLFVLIDQLTRTIYAFIEQFIRIVEFFIGCFLLIRSIFSSLHLIIARLMMVTSKIQRVFQLLAIVLDPFVPGGDFEICLRTFSRFLHDYYSSRGGCYSLQARTRHVVHIIRARWTKTKSIHSSRREQEIDDNVFYDALELEES